MEQETIKPDLSADAIDYKVFQVVKYVASRLYSDKKCLINYNKDQIKKDLVKAGLSSEIVLLECLVERVNRHNGLMETAMKKVSALKEHNWKNSSLLRGIGIHPDEVRKLVKRHQFCDSWEIYKVYFNSNYTPKQ